MGILDEFDPRHDGWQFANWGEGSDFSWDLYRRTYLAINPSNDPVAAPLDVAFYQVFKSCAKNGNCGGLSMLALALFKYGGFMGWCSPPDFYLPANMTDHKQPARADLHAAINIMQARQFSAAGIRNFLDVVKAGQLSDGITAWKRTQSGLASGDYCLLSISNGLFGDAAHTVIPYRAEMSGSAYVLHVWNSNRPYKWFPQHYDGDHNKIVITGPTAWTYDQNGGVPGGVATVYDGSKNGWCFAIPTSLILHKGQQPISPGFLLTGVLTLFVSGIGAAITQVEDDQGRRLYTSERRHRSRTDLETAGSQVLPGVARWPWPGGVSGEAPGELLFLERPPGSGPLTVSVRGDSYHLTALSAGRLTEVVAGTAAATARDRVRLSTGEAGGGHDVEVSTGAPSRHFDIHHLRHEGGVEWRSVRLRDVRITADRLRLHAPVSFSEVEISGTTARRDLDVELRRYDGEHLTRRTIAAQTVPAGRAVRLAPNDWTKLARGKVDARVS
ncbi:MAG: hypothetical protein ABI624_01330 [Casimicrobiaceae bacterium]